MIVCPHCGRLNENIEDTFGSCEHCGVSLNPYSHIANPIERSKAMGFAMREGTRNSSKSVRVTSWIIVIVILLTVISAIVFSIIEK